MILKVYYLLALPLVEDISKGICFTYSLTGYSLNLIFEESIMWGCFKNSEVDIENKTREMI